MPTVFFLFIVLVILLLLYYFVVIKNKSIPLSRSINKYQTIEDKYQEKKYLERKKLDRLLEKVNSSGLKSLTKTEVQKLNELSKRL